MTPVLRRIPQFLKTLSRERDIVFSVEYGILFTI
jgi:hypothetical protein